MERSDCVSVAEGRPSESMRGKRRKDMVADTTTQEDPNITVHILAAICTWLNIIMTRARIQHRYREPLPPCSPVFQFGLRNVGRGSEDGGKTMSRPDSRCRGTLVRTLQPPSWTPAATTIRNSPPSIHGRRRSCHGAAPSRSLHTLILPPPTLPTRPAGDVDGLPPTRGCSAARPR
jgi:hypothetical protein